MVDGIRITVSDEAVMAALDRVERASGDMLPVMQAISGYMVTSTQRHFETERGPDGPWKRLSSRTAARRIGRRQRGYENILRVTGRLYSSITGDATPTEATVGTNAIQAAIQQLGGTIDMPTREQDIFLTRTNRGRRFTRVSAKRAERRRVKVGAHQVTIPARPYLYVDAGDAAEIEAIAADVFAREAGLP